MTRRHAVRTALGILTAIETGLGSWALVFPHSFYRNLGLGTGSVALLPPYNEHAVTDIGGLWLGAVLFGVVAIWLEPTRAGRTVRGAVLGLPHFLFHLGHLQDFGTAAKIEQTAGLAILVLGPAVLLVRTRPGAAWRS